MFDPIMEQLLLIARDAWAFLAGLLVVVAFWVVCTTSCRARRARPLAPAA